MFCHVVLFCLVLICKKPSGADEVKPSLADKLNATLSSSGWMWITEVGAKLPFAVNGHESFNGKSLFVSDNVFFENGNFFNTLVRDDNASVKHFMVTHLVGCVYVNAMVKFIDLLGIIFEEVHRVMRNIKALAKHRKKMKLGDVEKTADKAVPVQTETTVQQSFEGYEENSDTPSDRPTDEEFVDFKVPWEILNFALLQLTDSNTMFDLMLSTMRYLIDTIPSDEPFGYDPQIWELIDIRVIPSLQLFKVRSRNINLVLSEYIGKTDPDYNDKVGPFAYKFIAFLNDQADTVMLPFLDRFCTVSEMARPNLKALIGTFKTRYRRKPISLDIAHHLGEEIRQLVLEVCNNYHSQLGFLYDIREQKTSYRNPPTL